jgi:hypothetical protein
VDRYSFIAMDLHHLLLAGLPLTKVQPDGIADHFSRVAVAGVTRGASPLTYGSIRVTLRLS